MSTEQVDQQVLENTRRHIQMLVGEIAQLARSGMAPQEFYGEFLGRVVTALAAIGGAVWAKDDSGSLALQYQVNLAQTGLPDKDEKQRLRHARLMNSLLASGQGALVPPQSGGANDDDPGNPTDALLIVGPLRTEIGPVGLVEVFQRADAAPNAQKGYLRFILQMCDLAGEFLKSHQLRGFSDRQSLWTQLETFTQTIHSSLDPRQTAYTIANEGRRLIDCDRVTIALRRGSKCQIEAISGQDVIDKRSNTVRLLGKLATEVVAAGEDMWYTGDTRDLAPQVEEAVQEYVDEAHSKTIAVLPLKRPEAVEEDRAKRDKPQPPFGALIIEQIEDSRIPETMIQRVEVVGRHAASALGNAVEHHNVFLMPLWRAVGNSKWMVRARTLPKTIAVASAVLLALLALVFVPADFELTAKGTLEPMNRRDVFAGVDGVVEKLFVNHGDNVKAEQPLALLRNTELGVAITEVVGQRTTTRQRILSVQRALLEESKLTVEERNRLAGELLELKQKLTNLDDQHRLYLEKQQELDVKSPTTGRVVTWDLYNRLIQRPVSRGQVLMRIAEPDGPWQLELKMPDDRMAHITRARRDLGPELPVSYILASDPGTTRQGKVREVQLSAEVRDESGATVLTKVDVDRGELGELLRPGTTVTAKVYCGRRSIGYVWFHDLFAFFHSRVFFPLF